ncbi:freyrasin family ranthipeptide [Paenibacillus polymyxa]|nr:freyrasin family ranthipeptide [Paenibacillus polymyxa]
MLKQINVIAGVKEPVRAYGCTRSDFCLFCDTSDYCKNCDRNDLCIKGDE